MKKKIYIASPYTKGDVALNVKRQITCADNLINLGFAPYVPNLTHFQHMLFPRPYNDWLDLDFEWIKVCDALLRLDGESNGADKEVEFAKGNNIHVFYSIDELCHFYGVEKTYW